MRLKRDKIRLIRHRKDDDDGFVEGEPGALFVMVWEITSDVWSFGGKDVERRLQRDVVSLVRRDR